ncbi:putative aarF domain-containing protein kinase 2 [Strix uralensis]|uniref:putative aarF domain-containing protein kinase 2 n=1 Tax=Strix uralensis TaxID=36305 RepID=UPI003DA75C83
MVAGGAARLLPLPRPLLGRAAGARGAPACWAAAGRGGLRAGRWVAVALVVPAGTGWKERPGQRRPVWAGERGPERPARGPLRRLGLALRLGLRACGLLLRFGPLLLLYPLSRLWPGLGTLWLRLLRRAAEAAGPTCVKLGQWASTRRDLFSEAFCDEFSKLHVEVSPHPWAHTDELLRKAFGEGWTGILEFQSREPVGSGCVAQVYKAYADLTAIAGSQAKELVQRSELRSAFEAWEVSGFRGLLRWLRRRKSEEMREERSRVELSPADCSRGSPVSGTSLMEQMAKPLLNANPSSARHLTPVAIKVLHPGLVHQVQMDLFLMKMGSHIIGLLPGFKWLSLTEIVEEFEKLMIQQIDLRYEARNLERFRQNFLDVNFVKFPTPVRPLVTTDVLVETFEESEPISHYLHAEIATELRKRIAKMGMDMLLKMVFVDNFVHADLHPGNILVQGMARVSPGCKEQTAIVDLCDTLVVEVQPPLRQLCLVLLDAGIVAELQSTDMQNFRAVFTAVVQGQGERVAELILHHARANQCQDIERFKAEMAELVTKVRGNTIALGKLQVANLLSNVFKLLMTHKVKLESNFASIIFAIMVLEGLGRSLDPELDILEAAKPLLIKTSASVLK